MKVKQGFQTVENKQLLKSFEMRSNVPRAAFKEARCVEVKAGCKLQQRSLQRTQLEMGTWAVKLREKYGRKISSVKW